MMMMIHDDDDDDDEIVFVDRLKQKKYGCQMLTEKAPMLIDCPIYRYRQYHLM